MIEDLALRAAHIRQHDRASVHVAMVNEKAAVQIAAQEVAREYGLHMLSKLLLYWRKAFGADTQILRDYPSGPKSLAAAFESLQHPVWRMVTAHTILDILDEAWEMRRLGEAPDSAPDLPAGLPNWMARRAPKEQLWTQVVFHTLFEPPEKVIWVCNVFLVFYERLRDLYNAARHPDAVPFRDAFQETIGRYVTVMFNPDRSKEMSVRHGPNYRHGHLPPFFRILRLAGDLRCA